MTFSRIGERSTQQASLTPVVGATRVAPEAIDLAGDGDRPQEEVRLPRSSHEQRLREKRVRRERHRGAELRRIGGVWPKRFEEPPVVRAALVAAEEVGRAHIGEVPHFVSRCTDGDGVVVQDGDARPEAVARVGLVRQQCRDKLPAVCCKVIAMEDIGGAHRRAAARCAGFFGRADDQHVATHGENLAQALARLGAVHGGHLRGSPTPGTAFEDTDFLDTGDVRRRDHGVSGDRDSKELSARLLDGGDAPRVGAVGVAFRDMHERTLPIAEGDDVSVDGQRLNLGLTDEDIGRQPPLTAPTSVTLVDESSTQPIRKLHNVSSAPTTSVSPSMARCEPKSLMKSIEGERNLTTFQPDGAEASGW